MTINKAIGRGLLVVNGPVTLLLFGPVYAVYALGFGRPVVYITATVGFVLAWTWWSVTIPRWRLWAYERVADIPKLKRRAVEVGLTWPDSSVFRRTEIKSPEMAAREQTFEFYPAIWNVLHDGVIQAIEEESPGAIRLTISIEYSRARFAGPGDSLRVVLTGCTRFVYRHADDGPAITDLRAIAAQQPEILSAVMAEDVCQVTCSDGTLEVVATGGTIRLDSGRAVTLPELIKAADRYWKEFAARSRR